MTIRVAPPWPSMTPEPMMAEPGALRAAMRGLQSLPESVLTVPQEPGVTAYDSGLRVA